jgi:hypothetical protein
MTESERNHISGTGMIETSNRDTMISLTMLSVKHLLPNNSDYFINNYMYRIDTQYKQLIIIQDYVKINCHNQQIFEDVFNYTERNIQTKQEKKRFCKNVDITKIVA